MPMSQEHKDALAQGRKEAGAIKAYLKAIEVRKPGRPVTKEGLEARLARVKEKIAASDNALKSVELIQTRLDIEGALSQLDEAENIEQLEAGFLSHVAAYSERKGISYPAWRELGVAATTLKRAGVPETRRR